jgi:hypothetical protein
MASIALDLSIGDVPLMEEFRGERNIDDIMLFVAFQALVLRNMPIALVDPRVAIQTIHPPADIPLMVEAHSPYQDIPFWLDMARSTFRTGKALVFSLWTGCVKVADEAIYFSYLEMSALDDLVVAGVAP